jgi:plasmid maintenance system antidote protein VapI
MALRIERWLGRDHGGAAEVWLAQQAAYDLWQARAAARASKTLSGVKTLKLDVTLQEMSASRSRAAGTADR